ncbi:synaptotagmin-4-like isoform X2 [Pecten maximus]|uniref:synaptotagmin-4-like isoform X2 n=1 Tax=Pecten maximus TaxID=6579 RepID=UPI001458F6D3|nr:synaptotagmin-4-like isoform X2 [Pecten maximus]
MFTDTSGIIIASSISIVTCIVFIVTCTICLRRKRVLRRKLVLGHNLVEMPAYNPFSIASVPNQTKLPDSEERIEADKDVNENTRLGALDMDMEHPGYGVTEKPGFGIEECGLRIPFSRSSSEESGQSRPSSSLSVNVPRKSLATCSATQSMADLLLLESSSKSDTMLRSCSMNNLDLSFDDRAFDGIVKTSFTVNYDEWNFTLTVNLHSVSNLPTKAQACNVFATVCLMPDTNEKRQTKVLPCVGDNVCFEEQYTFHNVRKRILENGTIRISIYRQKRSMKTKKDSLLGELFLKCSDVDMQCNIPTRFSKLDAPRKRLTRMSTSEKLLHKNLGEFFVDLQYQSLADRLKVFVRKAIQLPPSDRLMVVKPAHYVVVKLIRDGTVVEVQKTRTSSGRIAVWNEAFLFHVDKNLDSYSLEFLIMKGKFHKKDLVVGKVEIGPNCSRRGRDHWNSMIRPRPVDVAKWHSILPVFAY